jgi:N-acetylglucosaminyldiphosphoundecaprenol N-acetyl-beta-D-mannosaminyltransferase
VIARFDVLGVGISAVDMGLAVDTIASWIDAGERRYVCVTGVHGVMEAQRDADLLAIHNRSGLTTPDGMPMVWAGRWAGMGGVRRVYGPDLLLAVCALACRRGWTSFFYGGRPGVAELLAARLREWYPGLRIAGTLSPPFRPLTPEEDQEVVRTINAHGPDILWVGLGTPAQERWMAAHRARLTAPAIVGIGAAFDIHAGVLPQAPRWIRHSGFEWLFRLAVEPRRLWRRYLTNNPRFVVRVLQHPPRPMP